MQELVAAVVSRVGPEPPGPLADSLMVLDWELKLSVNAFLERNHAVLLEGTPMAGTLGETSARFETLTDSALIARIVPYNWAPKTTGADRSVIRVSPKPQGGLPAKIKESVVSVRVESAWKVYAFKTQPDALAAYKYFQHRGFNVTLGPGSTFS